MKQKPGQKPGPKPSKPKHEETDANCMKLALWYIDKCGSIERARRAFRAAAGGLSTMQKLEDPNAPVA